MHANSPAANLFSTQTQKQATWYTSNRQKITVTAFMTSNNCQDVVSETHTGSSASSTFNRVVSSCCCCNRARSQLSFNKSSCSGCRYDC